CISSMKLPLELECVSSCPSLLIEKMEAPFAGILYGNDVQAVPFTDRTTSSDHRRRTFSACLLPCWQKCSPKQSTSCTHRHQQLREVQRFRDPGAVQVCNRIVNNPR